MRTTVRSRSDLGQYPPAMVKIVPARLRGHWSYRCGLVDVGVRNHYSQHCGCQEPSVRHDLPASYESLDLDNGPRGLVPGDGWAVVGLWQESPSPAEFRRHFSGTPLH